MEINLKDAGMRFLMTLPLLFVLCSGCGLKQAPQPMKLLDKTAVPDGEFLRYGKYSFGEKTAVIYLVSRLGETAGGEAVDTCYVEGFKPGSGDKIPSNYRDYHGRRVFSLKTGSLKELFYNWPVENLSKNSADPSRFPGEYYRSFRMNGEDLDMESRVLRNDTTISIKSRVHVKNGYPLWDLDSTTLFSFRYFDMSRPGILYVVIPSLLKEPLPLSFKIIGREKIRTGLGEFETVKLGALISDPFLGKLMDGFVDSTTLWVEDSDRKLLFKMEAAGIKMELEAVSNVLKQR